MSLDTDTRDIDTRDTCTRDICTRDICTLDICTRDRDVVRHGGTNAKMTVSTENSHFLVNYSHLD